MKRKEHSTVKYNISMDKVLAEDLLNLSKEVRLPRSEVISDMVEYILNNEKLLDDLYPLEEEESEEEEGEEET